jgi:hypothetical protein
MINTVNNLDRLAAQYAQAVVTNTKDRKSSDVENTVTKALGVLQEDGVYASFLYLLAKEQASKEDKKKNKKSAGEVLIKHMLDLLEKFDFGWDKPKKEDGKADLSPDAVLKYVIDHVTQDLERLLLAKETLEQMLIYARYGAQARQDTEPENGQVEEKK